ncbi:MAG: dihydroorotate dehydrogenase (quinone) [Candidatus Caldarchaeum sp.]|nr:dihydroorotate dehydrogenase (quinone) [Candidatus Caldarchaeum sp.]
MKLVHKVLTKLPPEEAHNIGLTLLRLLPYKLDMDGESLHVETRFGRLKNPVGLAAGFDKSGLHVKHLAKLGFGYMVVGTVTKNPRRGLAKPRVVRRREEQGLVNAMAFPNPGLEQFIRNMSKAGDVGVPVLVSVSDVDEQNLVECYIKVQPLASGVEVNISSPNTPQLKHYFQKETFTQVAESLRQHKRKPTYLKIPPYANTDEKRIIDSVVKIWHDIGFEGVTAVNALLVDEPRVTAKMGGLSGKPLYPFMLKSVENIRRMYDMSFEVHAVGGISTGRQVYETLVHGANTVQLHTALAYRGASAVKEMLEELLDVLESENIGSLKDLQSMFRRAAEH